MLLESKFKPSYILNNLKINHLIRNMYYVSVHKKIFSDYSLYWDLFISVLKYVTGHRPSIINLFGHQEHETYVHGKYIYTIHLPTPGISFLFVMVIFALSIQTPLLLIIIFLKF